MNPVAASNAPSVGLKVALVLCCSAVVSVTSLIVRKAEHHDELAFSPLAASFFCEVLKLAVAVGLMVVHGPDAALAQLRALDRPTLSLFALPAVQYVLENNLR